MRLHAPVVGWQDWTESRFEVFLFAIAASWAWSIFSLSSSSRKVKCGCGADEIAGQVYAEATAAKQAAAAATGAVQLTGEAGICYITNASPVLTG